MAFIAAIRTAPAAAAGASRRPRGATVQPRAAAAEIHLAPLVAGGASRPRSSGIARASSTEFELRLAPLVDTPAPSPSSWASRRNPQPRPQPLDRHTLIARSASYGAAELRLAPLVAGVAPAAAPRAALDAGVRELRLASLTSRSGHPAAAARPSAGTSKPRLQRQRSSVITRAASAEIRLAPLMAGVAPLPAPLQREPSGGVPELRLARLI